MGQYHLTVNLDKREFIHPYGLGAGLKLCEQTGLYSIPNAIHMLLAISNGRGGGDFRDDPAVEAVVGRWGGDRIAVVGDYTEASDLGPEDRAEFIYSLCAREGEGDEKRQNLISWLESRIEDGDEELTRLDIEYAKTAPLFTDITAQVAAAIEAEFEVEFRPSAWGGWAEVHELASA